MQRNFSKPDVDGGLIGGAAQKQTILAIVNAI
jgi:triosephosphate isomerase